MLPKKSERFGKSSSELDNLFALSGQNEVISFAAGYPANELFPKKELDRAFKVRSTKVEASFYQYGEVLGYTPLRKKIVNYANNCLKINCAVENIMLTQGAQQGINLLAEYFLDVGDGIVVEAPSYIGALEAFEAKAPAFYEVPVREDGMDMDVLEETLMQHDVKLIYTIPNFQNPTGYCMSVAKRKQLVNLAQKYGVLVVEDDPYRELRFSGESLPTIKSFDTEGNVVTLGSFSKILSPALRTGWMIGDKNLIKALSNVRLTQDCQPSNIVSEMIDEYLESNDLFEHIQDMNKFYSQRKNVMIKALQANLPSGCSVSNPEGGFFIWVTLPENIDSNVLLQSNAGVTFISSGALFVVSHEKNHMRLNFSGVSPTLIMQGCKQLCCAIEEAIKKIAVVA